MLRNILAATLRNLARNKLYAAINILGLAVGFAAAILIGLYVRHEFSYDQWVPGHERVYTVSMTVAFPVGAPPRTIDSTRPALPRMLKTLLPDLEAVTRVRNEAVRVRHGDVEAGDDIDWADPDFFKVFPLPVLAGNPETALAEPNSLVLTRITAMKYFGQSSPIGETLEVGIGRTWHPMRVTAIIENLPTNTHLSIVMLGSATTAFSSLALDERAGSTAENGNTYFRVRPGVSVEDLRQVGPALLRLQSPEIDGQGAQLGLDPDDLVAFDFIPIGKLHLRPAGMGAPTPSANEGVLNAMAIIGLLTIVIAGINFANLSAARSGRRSVEVGIRKTAGARQLHLIVQFLGESLIYAAASMALALALVEIALPTFRAATDAHIAFDYWRDMQLAAAILCVTLVVGLAAGLYPAFILSAFRVNSVVKGAADISAGGGLVRRGLVILQFGVLIGIGVATLTIYRQTQFALNEGLKVNKDQVLIVQGGCDETRRAEIAALVGVRAASCTSNTILATSFRDTEVRLPGGQFTVSRSSQVDYGLFELYGLSPIAGRFFSRDFATDRIADPDLPDNPSIVVNESALARLQLGTAEEAIGKTVTWGRAINRRGAEELEPRPSTVIGVVSDFQFRSIRAPIESQIYYIDPTFFSAVSAKLDGARVPETLAALDSLAQSRGERPSNRVFLDEYMQRQYADVMRQAATFASFAGLTLFIACIGLLGLATFNAERRTKEIGIRKGMGAGSADILKLLTWEFAKPVLLANLIAWPIAWWGMARWLEGFAYRIGFEPWIFLAAGGFALFVALATVSAHALLVLRSKPVTALRYE